MEAVYTPGIYVFATDWSELVFTAELPDELPLELLPELPPELPFVLSVELPVVLPELPVAVVGAVFEDCAIPAVSLLSDEQELDDIMTARRITAAITAIAPAINSFIRITTIFVFEFISPYLPIC